jgi:large repetitive protein
LGNGDGTFQAAVNYAVGSWPSSVAVGDFKGDGKLDLAVTNSGSNNVSVLLGNGDGTFGATVNYGAGSGPASLAVGDFNGDGKPDLARS